jgi:hypothetical protein
MWRKEKTTMADYLMKLPQSFEPVYAHAFGRSPARHIAASLAVIAQFVKPSLLARLSPQALATQIYEQYTGQPDIPSNTIGMTKAQVLDWLRSQQIGYIDMADQLSDLSTVKHEFQAQDISGVCQLFILDDGSHLRYAKNTQALHNWIEPSSDAPTSTSLVRIGFSDSQPQAYYLDGEAAPAFSQPLPILWQDLVDAGILACIAILPDGVSEAPPPSFRYFAGVDPQSGQLLPPNKWPVPVPPAPVIDVDQIASTLSAADTAITAINEAVAAVQAAHQNLLALLQRG